MEVNPSSNYKDALEAWLKESDYTVDATAKGLFFRLDIKGVGPKRFY